MVRHRQVSLKCCFCEKLCLRSDMIRVTSNTEQLHDWCKRLGSEFKERFLKVKNPFLCISHFPKKKAKNPRKHVLPYKGGYPPIDMAYGEDSSDENSDEKDDESWSDDSDVEDVYDEDYLEEDDDQVVEMSKQFDNILVSWEQLLPFISMCLICWKDGVKKYADVSTEQRGAAIKAKMVCARCDHFWSWTSSRICDDVPGKKGPKSYAINKWLVTGITITGNGFSKMKHFFDVLKTPFMSKVRFFELLSEKVQPAIEVVYKNHITEVLSKMTKTIIDNGPLNISGDGQYDSRGYSAYICRFSCMDIATRLILDFDVCRKKRGGSSVLLEKAAHGLCFPRLIETLRNLTKVENPVISLTTDRCYNITASMKNYPSVFHYYDGWHWIRSIRRDIMEKWSQKQFRPMVGWVQKFTNHMHTSIVSSNGDGTIAFETIMSFFHHCRNIHENFKEINSFKFDTVTRCSHPPGSDPSPATYLDLKNPADKKAFEVLLEIVSKPSRARDLQSVSPHLATSALESFHSLSLYYVPKEKFYDEKSYILRTKLGVLHWNHLQLEEMEGKRAVIGKTPYYCKSKKKVVLKDRKEAGSHIWRNTILELVLKEGAATNVTTELELEIRAETEAEMYRTPY